MLKTVLIVLVVLVAVAAVGVTWAKRSGYCSVENRMHHITERIGRKLDLNDDQQGHLEDLVETVRELRSERQDPRAVLQGHLTELLSEPSLDRDRAVAMIDERYRAMSDSKRALIDAFADFSDSLQPDQRTRLAELIGNRLLHRWGPPGWAH
jgi:Spy/CpxP family protein refolding chaperone